LAVVISAPVAESISATPPVNAPPTNVTLPEVTTACTAASGVHPVGPLGVDEYAEAAAANPTVATMLSPRPAETAATREVVFTAVPPVKALPTAGA
jgi:hypothetical protein